VRRLPAAAGPGLHFKNASSPARRTGSIRGLHQSDGYVDQANPCDDLGSGKPAGLHVSPDIDDKCYQNNIWQ